MPFGHQTPFAETFLTPPSTSFCMAVLSLTMLYHNNFFVFFAENRPFFYCLANCPTLPHENSIDPIASKLLLIAGDFLDPETFETFTVV